MTDAAAVPTPDQGTLARAVGIILSPGKTFLAVVRDPRPAVMLLLVAFVVALAGAVPQFTERGRQAAVDMQVQQTERMFGRAMTPEEYEATIARSRFGPYLAFAGAFVMLPVSTLIFSALYWFVFNAVLGGTATFKQVLGVTAHSQVIGALGALAGAPIMYAQGTVTTTGPFTLGAFAGMLEPGSFLSNFLSGIAVFAIWGLIVNAIGLGILYRRKTTGIAMALIAIYLVMVAGFAAVFSALGR
jgi:hypothetical protein